MQMEHTILNNGVAMPLIGLGVMEIENGEAGERVILDALEAGYRMIDTATVYFNEETVGRAIKKSGLPREELFVTTKFWAQDAGYENTKKAFQLSLEKLGLDYLDMYLVHVPFGDYYGSWRAMEELYEAGKIRAIGVCNFYPARLADLCMNVRIKPAVCQVEMHPFYQQGDAIANMKSFGVQPEAWNPLAHGRFDIFSNEVLGAIAKKHGKSISQVAIRWNVQRGVAVIPKSVKKARIEENFNVWDFSLTDEEMAAIAQLDMGHTEAEDPTALETAIGANQWKIHD